MLFTCDNIIEGNTYAIKNILKTKYKCYWDGETKKWTFEPIYKSKVDDFLNECNQNSSKNIKAIWKYCCDFLNIHYAKKGTNDYNVVKLKFNEILKEQRDNLHKSDFALV
jgi:hypothetical protein